MEPAQKEESNSAPIMARHLSKWRILKTGEHLSGKESNYEIDA